MKPCRWHFQRRSPEVPAQLAHVVCAAARRLPKQTPFLLSTHPSKFAAATAYELTARLHSPGVQSQPGEKPPPPSKVAALMRMDEKFRAQLERAIVNGTRPKSKMGPVFLGERRVRAVALPGTRRGSEALRLQYPPSCARATRPAGKRFPGSAVQAAHSRRTNGRVGHCTGIG